MQLTCNGLTALRLIRAIRTGSVHGTLSSRCNMHAPDPGEAGRWSSRLLQAELERFGAAGAFSPQQPLHVIVPRKEGRLQLKGVKCAFRTTPHPPGSFVDLGQGLAISSPELLFVELARVMEPAVHLLLGMELCGRFSRDAINPRNGTVTYNLDPVTSVARLRSYARKASAIRGARKALATIDRIEENAWSPMEALLAALIVLPGDEFGYDLWPISLNERKEASEHLRPYVSSDSRVPDLLFRGTSVGLNYDGEDHFGLLRIAQAAAAAERDPGNARLAREVGMAIADARQRIVSDKRRDRDLEAQGYAVFPVTKEDFVEEGGIDRVVMLAVDAMEHEGSRQLATTRRLLQDEKLATARQLFIWSLLPGRGAADARHRLDDFVAMQQAQADESAAQAQPINEGQQDADIRDSRTLAPEDGIDALGRMRVTIEFLNESLCRALSGAA